MAEQRLLSSATLAATAFATAVQGIANHESPALVAMFFFFTCVGITLAVTEAKEVFYSGLLGKTLRLAPWPVHIVTSWFYALRSRPPPPVVLNRHVAVHVCSLMVMIVHQRDCGILLPQWLVLLLSEVHACAHWVMFSRQHDPWVQFVLSHISTLVLPALLLHYFKSQYPQQAGKLPNNGKPDGAHARGASSALEDQPTGSTSTIQVPANAVVTPAQPSSAPAPRMSNAGSLHPSLPQIMYRSVLGDRQMVSAKIATSHHPAQVHPRALDNLARRIEDLSSDLLVLGASVRYGCILISMNVLKVPATSQPANGNVLDLAEQLLPDLLQQLELCDDSSCAPGLQPGEYLNLQLGDQLVHATYDVKDHKWMFVNTTLPDKYASGCIQLCLASPSPPPTQMSSSSVHSDMHVLAFQVHAQCSNVVGLPLVVGSNPAETRAPANLHCPDGEDTSTSKPTLQLWVNCQGQYLQTTIVQAPRPGDRAGQVQAVVQLPNATLARHHLPDGPIARLQLLTAELWDGDRLLSSTVLLADAEQHLSSGTSCSFGWWGASPAAAAGLVHELSAVTEQLQASATAGNAEEHIQGHEGFVSDLAAWLSTMQHAAPGACCDMASPQVSAGLPLHQCHILGQHLEQFASTAHLPHTLNLLHAQHSTVLRAWQHSTTCGSRVQNGSHPAMWLAWVVSFLRGSAVQLARCGVLTPLCPACDNIYYNRLRAYLHHVSLGVGLMQGLLCIRLMLYIAGLQPTALAIHAWSVVHLAAGASHWLVPVKQQPKVLQWLVRDGGLHGLSWCIHLLNECALVHSWIAMLPEFCRTSTLIPILGPQPLISVITEQVYTWGRWPGWLGQAFTMLDAVNHYCLAQRCGQRSGPLHNAMMVLLVLGTVVLPLAMRAHWRHLLRNSRSTAGLPNGK